MDILVPDIYAQSIYSIDYEKLKKRNIKCLLIDLDNTIAPIDIKEPDKKIKELFNELECMGFKIIIISNSPKNRVRPFKEHLNVDSAYSAHKPFSKKYNKNVTLENKVDESVLGGVLVRLGNTEIDGTIKTRLDGLKDQLSQVI